MPGFVEWGIAAGVALGAVGVGGFGYLASAACSCVTAGVGVGFSSIGGS